METIETSNLDETYAFGRQFAQRLQRGDCVALIGNLGAGKTALIRGIALGLGLQDDRMVSSPTFVLMQEYPGRLIMHHIDLYRMKQPELELPDLGLEEMLEDGVVLIEWADRAPRAMPRPRWQIEIESTGETSRKLKIARID